SAMETLLQVTRDEPVSPRRLAPKVPRDLETICLKCLHKDPARRYPACAALADDLKRFLAGEPISARPVGWTERTAKWVRRRPGRAALQALSVTLALGLLLLVFALWRNAEQKATLAQERAGLALDLEAARQEMRQADEKLQETNRRITDKSKLLADLTRDGE